MRQQSVQTRTEALQWLNPHVHAISASSTVAHLTVLHCAASQIFPKAIRLIAFDCHLPERTICACRAWPTCDPVCTACVGLQTPSGKHRQNQG